MTSDTLVEKSDIRRAATRNMVRAKETRRPASLAMMESRPANANTAITRAGWDRHNSGNSGRPLQKVPVQFVLGLVEGFLDPPDCFAAHLDETVFRLIDPAVAAQLKGRDMGVSGVSRCFSHSHSGKQQQREQAKQVRRLEHGNRPHWLHQQGFRLRIQ